MTLERNDEFPYSEFSTRLGCVHTKQSRVQFSTVRLTKTRKWLCGLPTTAAAAAPTQQQGRVAVCFIFVSQTPVIGRDVKNGCTGAQFFVKDHKAIYDASRCEHRNRNQLAITSFGRKLQRRWALVGGALRRFVSYFEDNDVSNNKKTVIMFLLLLCLLFKDFVRYFWRSK